MQKSHPPSWSGHTVLFDKVTSLCMCLYYVAQLFRRRWWLDTSKHVLLWLDNSYCATIHIDANIDKHPPPNPLRTDTHKGTKNLATTHVQLSKGKITQPGPGWCVVHEKISVLYYAILFSFQRRNPSKIWQEGEFVLSYGGEGRVHRDK